MDNPWVPSVGRWRLKLCNGEPIDCTVDTPDRALFEEMGEEVEDLEEFGPLAAPGRSSKMQDLILLA